MCLISISPANPSMGTEVWLPLQFTGAGRVPYFMWWLCTSRSCVFLPSLLPSFPSVFLQWKQVLCPFHVGYLFRDFFFFFSSLGEESKCWKRCHWKWLWVFVRLMEEWWLCCYLLWIQGRYCLFSASSIAEAEVLPLPRLCSPHLKQLWDFGRQLCSSSSQPSGCLLGHCTPFSECEQDLSSELWCLTPYFFFSFRSPETGTWSSNLPTSKASKYW